jgi:hypothetical protein
MCIVPKFFIDWFMMLVSLVLKLLVSSRPLKLEGVLCIYVLVFHGGQAENHLLCFSIWFEDTFDFHCFIFMIFHLCSFSCYNMVAKFLLSWLCLSCPFFSSLISAFNALPRWSNCVGACHLKNYSFVITYLLEDEHELSLGMLIHLKRIYNFWCSMLVYTPFALCFITLRGVLCDFRN